MSANQRIQPFLMRRESAPINLLLDDFPGAVGAYSFRKLRAGYIGNCLRVRRSSDNTTSEIGFLGNILDTASMLSFVGAGDGFIEILYDQSGSANNISQTTLASQPKIVSSGSLLVDGNGKAVAKFDGTDDFLFRASKLGFYDHGDVMFAVVYKKIYTGTGEKDLISESSTTSNFPLYRVSQYLSASANRIFIRNDSVGSVLDDGHSGINNAFAINTFFVSKTAGILRENVNGSLGGNLSFTPSGSVTVNRFAIGALVRASVSLYSGADFQEFVFWPIDHYSDQSNISANQNSFYNHY